MMPWIMISTLRIKRAGNGDGVTRAGPDHDEQHEDIHHGYQQYRSTQDCQQDHQTSPQEHAQSLTSGVALAAPIFFCDASNLAARCPTLKASTYATG